MSLNWPLMENNITRADLDELIQYLETEPILTQSMQVQLFEEEWSEWLGTKYSVFVNSGSSANLITIATLKAIHGGGEIIVSPLGWVSDVAAVLQNGFQPVFADINPKTLSMGTREILKKIKHNTKAVLVTHVQGFNGLTDELLDELQKRNISLIEDVCESHGATHHGRKLGSFGLMSNFSFYYAHHMSTIEGGMICTNDETIYQILRMYRSHGMVREATDDNIKQKYINEYPDLNPDFIFAYPAYNVRSTEVNAVIGRAQLKRLDQNNEKRKENFKFFLDHLSTEKYRTNFELEGSCNYAFNLIINKPDIDFCNRVMDALCKENIEFRKGSAGGGNQMRQPYLKDYISENDYKNYPEVEHIHFYSFYLGNYPDLPKEKILKLCKLLNSLE
jgi:CDP-4-dehydro-6-deoxyglucose reductase, E1